MQRHSFFIASDTATYQEYFELRAKEYQRTFGFDGAWLQTEDGYDHSGVILVCADTAGRIIAGARMNISTPAQPMRLPMEYGSFSLSLLLPSMNLAQRNYSEVSRLAVAEEYQNGQLLLELLDALHEYARSQATPLVFSICPRVQARRYRILRSTGRMNKPFYIFKDIAVPAQFDIEMRLCVFAEEGELECC